MLRGKTLRVTTWGVGGAAGKEETDLDGGRGRESREEWKERCAERGRNRSVLAISHSVTAPWFYGAFPVMVLLFN